MSDRIDVKFEGLKETMNALETLPDALRDEIIGRANRDILNRIVKPDIIGSIPYNENSKRGVGVRSERGNKTAFWVGITTKAYWLRFVEYGTSPRSTRQGYNRGIMPKKSFLDRVLTGSVNKVSEEIRKEYGNIIRKHLEKKLKSVGKKMRKYGL